MKKNIFIREICTIYIYNGKKQFQNVKKKIILKQYLEICL